MPAAFAFMVVARAIGRAGACTCDGSGPSSPWAWDNARGAWARAERPHAESDQLIPVPQNFELTLEEIR